MILLGRDCEITPANAAAVAIELADSIARRSRDELRDVLAEMRRAAGDVNHDASRRATAAVQATAIDRYLERGEDPLPVLRHMCEVAEAANTDPRFDWLRALFQIDEWEIR